MRCKNMRKTIEIHYKDWFVSGSSWSENEDDLRKDALNKANEFFLNKEGVKILNCIEIFKNEEHGRITFRLGVYYTEIHLL